MTCFEYCIAKCNEETREKMKEYLKYNWVGDTKNPEFMRKVIDTLSRQDFTKIQYDQIKDDDFVIMNNYHLGVIKIEDYPYVYHLRKGKEIKEIFGPKEARRAQVLRLKPKKPKIKVNND